MGGTHIAWRWALAATLGLVVTLALIVPWQAGSLGGDLDYSWGIALAVAFERGIAFGRDLVFSFGPWGFLFQRLNHPPTLAWLRGAWVVLAVVLWLGTFATLRRGWRHPEVAVLMYGCLLALMTLGSRHYIDAVLSAFAILLLLCALLVDPTGRPPVLAALAFAAAWAALVKFTFFATAVPVVAAIAIDDVARRKRIPWVPAVFATSLLGLWVLAGQRPSAFGAFLAMSTEIARGYPEAMSHEGPTDEIVVTGLAAAALLLVEMREQWARRRAWAILPVAALAAVFAIALKRGFTRHDVHALEPVMVLLVFAWLRAPLLLGSPRRRSQLGLTLAALTALLWMHWTILERQFELNSLESVVSSAREVPRGLAAAARVARDDGLDGQRWSESLAQLRRAKPLPSVAGRVDVYPWDITMVVAHGHVWHPRPVIQSYKAYTPMLQRLNAEHLRGPQAPDTILFDVMSVGDRFPTFDDGRSWPDLLTRYDVAELGTMLVMKRATSPRDYRFELLDRREALAGTRIDVPPAGPGPIWVSIDVRPTWLGAVANMVLRPAKVRIEVTTRTGEPRTFLLLPALARDGFLLSPLVEDVARFTALASGGRIGAAVLTGSEVVSIRIRRGGSRRYERRVQLEFARLVFPPQPLDAVVGVDHLRELMRLGGAGMQSGQAVTFHREATLGPVVFAHAPNRIPLEHGTGASALRVRFGLLDGAWNGGDTDGVEFRVTGVRAGARATLWSRRLDPRTVREDRGPQTAQVLLAGVDPGSVQLETLPGASANWDWSYWAEASFLGAPAVLPGPPAKPATFSPDGRQS